MPPGTSVLSEHGLHSFWRGNTGRLKEGMDASETKEVSPRSAHNFKKISRTEEHGLHEIWARARSGAPGHTGTFFSILVMQKTSALEAHWVSMPMHLKSEDGL